jgi:hypothetical protein
MTLNDKSTSSDIAQHYAQHMPAPDYIRQDYWENGTLVRVTPKSRPLWPFMVLLVPLTVIAGLALGVLIERMWM